MRSLAVALVHHPVLGRGNEILTTTVTNLDLHDLSRIVRTYGLDGLYIVHPLASQRLLSQRIVEHWVHGAGGRRIPDRAEALTVVRIVSTLEEARAAVGETTELWTTAASAHGAAVTSFAAGRALLAGAGPPVLLAFGTGWGLAPEVLEQASVRLAPIEGARGSGYNHLSVRAACAIAVDRLIA